jgi:hypothetical protein
MSNIAIVLIKEKLEVSILKEIHILTGGSLAKIRLNLLNNRPIVELELFDNQYDEKAKVLRKLIEICERYYLETEIYELPSGDDFETSLIKEESKISLNILKNILDSSDDEIERFL